MVLVVEVLEVDGSSTEYGNGVEVVVVVVEVVDGAGGVLTG